MEIGFFSGKVQYDDGVTFMNGVRTQIAKFESDELLYSSTFIALIP